MSISVRQPLSTFILAMACMAFATVASAHSGNDDPNVIHACINRITKIARIVGVSGACVTAPQTLAETPAHWQIVGVAGPQGAQGIPGPAGARGATGLQGATGLTGATGPQGASGAQGVAGAAGAIGPQGPQGVAGVAGIAGVPGTPGSGATVQQLAAGGPCGAGRAGALITDGFGNASILCDGATGLIGLTGATGPVGPAGPAGTGTGGTRADGPCARTYYDVPGKLQPNRYADCGNGTVTDSVTGLVWLKQPNCLASDWPGATQMAANLHQGVCGLNDGSSPGDWRLPTLEEWQATLAKGFAMACIDPALTNDAGTGCGGPSALAGTTYEAYWSSTTWTDNSFYAWYADVINGGTVTAPKSSGSKAWPVRSH